MIPLFAILALAASLTDARYKPDIQFFEIHDTENGLQLKKINSGLLNHDQIELLDRLPNNNQDDNLAEGLIDKLKHVKGKNDIYMVSECPNLFILGKDSPTEEDEEFEEKFVDKTRNGPKDVQRYKDILLQLMALKSKKQQVPATILRDGININDRTSAPRHKSLYESDYVDYKK